MYVHLLRCAGFISGAIPDLQVRATPPDGRSTTSGGVCSSAQRLDLALQFSVSVHGVRKENARAEQSEKCRRKHRTHRYATRCPSQRARWLHQLISRRKNGFMRATMRAIEGHASSCAPVAGLAQCPWHGVLARCLGTVSGRATWSCSVPATKSRKALRAKMLSSQGLRP